MWGTSVVRLHRRLRERPAKRTRDTHHVVLELPTGAHLLGVIHPALSVAHPSEFSSMTRRNDARRARSPAGISRNELRSSIVLGKFDWLKT
jgi:hypothetical protein